MTDQTDIPVDRGPSIMKPYYDAMVDWLKKSTRRSLIISNSALVFVLALLVQIRLQGTLDRSMLAMIGLGILILSALIGYYVQARIGAKVFKLEFLKWATELSSATEERMSFTEDDTKRVHQRRAAWQSYINDHNEVPINGIPMLAITIQWICIGVGITICSIYFWLYLFY